MDARQILSKGQRLARGASKEVGQAHAVSRVCASFRQEPASIAIRADDLDIGEELDIERDLSQVMLRWHIQEGRQAIPKSVHAERIADHFDVLDFELSAEELSCIDALERGMTMVPDELDLDAVGIEVPEP